MSIHPTALVAEGVRLGAGCVVNAHAVIHPHTILGDGVIYLGRYGQWGDISG